MNFPLPPWLNSRMLLLLPIFAAPIAIGCGAIWLLRRFGLSKPPPKQARPRPTLLAYLVSIGLLAASLGVVVVGRSLAPLGFSAQALLFWVAYVGLAVAANRLLRDRAVHRAAALAGREDFDGAIAALAPVVARVEAARPSRPRPRPTRATPGRRRAARSAGTRSWPTGSTCWACSTPSRGTGRRRWSSIAGPRRSAGRRR